jgi:uracil-DNA glycosylase family 4
MGSLLVGGAGDIFWSEITRAGLGNYNAFVASAAMCHIPKEEGLKIKEVNTILNNCRCHLERALKTLKPKLIVTMGALSSQQLIKMKTLGDRRGTFIWSEEFNCYVFPTYDPYYCTKKPSAASLFAADLRRVKTFLIGGEVVIEDKEIVVERRETIADIIASSKVVAVDTETQGLDYINPSGIMVSYSVSNDPRKAYQVFLHEECKEEEADFSINWERGKGKARKWTKVFVRKCSNFETKVRELGELLENENIKKVFMNVKYDLHHIAALFRNNKLGELKLGGAVIDVRDLSHCISEEIYARSSLEFLRKSFTTLNTQYSDEFDATFDKSDMLAIPQDELTKYAASDACVTYNVAMGVIKALKQEPTYEQILFYYKNMVQPTTNCALFAMEENGVKTDMTLLPSVKEDLRKELDYLYIKIMASIPHCIKDKYIDKRTPEAPLTKTNMIREMLYTKAGLGIKQLIDKKTKKPIDSIEKKTRTLLLSTKLSKIAIEFIASYDKWKMIDTLLSRYITGIEKATRLDGKIHPSFSLSVAATGRSNSASPNLQNIPKRGPLAKTIRKLFVASPGYSFISADASQAEIRWAAFLAQEQNMIDIYRAGGDIHTATAEAVLGKKKEDMTPEEFKDARQKGKSIVFGFLYSAGALTFQRVAKTDYGVDLTERQAQEFREGFFNAYPAIQEYHYKVKRECHRYGYVVSPLGRVRHLPEVHSNDNTIVRRAERQALNHAIQSVSSDTVLLSCLEIMKVADPNECRPVLFIHDELTMEVLDSEIDKYAKLIKYHMVNPPLAQFRIELNLPLDSDLKVGPSLADMVDYKIE